MLLERGQFTAESTALTTTALAFYSFGLIGHSAVEILARAFYALHDTRTPVTIGIGAMALNVVLSILLRGSLAHGGLALANTIATLIEMGLMFAYLSIRIGGLDWGALWAHAQGGRGVAGDGRHSILDGRPVCGGLEVPRGYWGAVGGRAGFSLLVAFALRTPEFAMLAWLMPGRPRESATAVAALPRLRPPPLAASPPPPKRAPAPLPRRTARHSPRGRRRSAVA